MAPAQNRHVNTASENLAQHLKVLGEKLLHPTAYEQALSYFLEEFAGDTKFVSQSECEEGLHLKAVLTKVASEALEQPAAELQAFKAFRLPEHAFNHGNAAVAGRVLLFFYFEKLDTGLMALFPGIHGAAEVARFKIPGGMTKPRNN